MRAALVGAAACLLAGCLSPSSALGCANETMRQGASAELPDCRAYELVSPADSNGIVPVTAAEGLTGVSLGGTSNRFSSAPAGGSGGSFVFGTLGGALPGTDGGGFLGVYRSVRGASGWSSSSIGPSAQQAFLAVPGGFDADQSTQAFLVRHVENRAGGSLDLGDHDGVDYLRLPDGSFRLVGEGTLPAEPDPDANPNGFADELRPTVRWISPHGDHVIFSQGPDPVRLLPDAPPEGVAPVYDRTERGLHVASLLPGDVPPSAPSTFEGASADGSTVLFRTESTLYARISNASTVPVATGPVLAAGASSDGHRVFYVDGEAGTGNLYSFEPASGTRRQLNTSGDARFVNVAPDGSHVYYESPSLLDGSGVAEPGEPGDPKLYVWDGSVSRLIAAVRPADLTRAELFLARLGLAQWVEAATMDAPARNSGFLTETSRTNSTGTAFAFESGADPLGENPAGTIQIYRYSTEGEGLQCVSCGDGSNSDATFADYSFTDVGTTTIIPNLSEDGKTIFFQTSSPLLPRDSNGEADVYEWHDGRLSLISSGRDSQPSLLMGATPSGDDVFIRTGQRLLSGGQEPGFPAIYDARVEGGFPAPAASGPCPLESCQGDPPAVGGQPPPASALFVGPRRSRHRARPRRDCRRRHRHHRHCKRTGRAGTGASRGRG